MNLPRFLVSSLAAAVAIVAVLVFQSFGQQPPRTQYRVQEVVEQLPNGTFIKRHVTVPVTTVDGGSVLLGGVHSTSDPESQKLVDEEQALAREVRRLSDNLRGIDGTPPAKQAEWKAEMREKLAAIFDLQQQRRTREIAKIEERLAKLKDVLKKRDTAKDEIVDRRLSTLTGGVDELGWQESLPPETLLPGTPTEGASEFVPPPTVRPRSSGASPFAPLPPVGPRSRPENPLAPAPAAAAPAAPATQELPGGADSSFEPSPPVAPAPVPAPPAAPRR